MRTPAPDSPTPVNPGPSIDSVKIDDIKKIVADSAAANEVPAGASIKRGRGRPRKDGQPSKADLKRMGIDGSDPLGAVNEDPLGSAGIDSGAAAGTTAAPEPIPVEVLVPMLKLPYSIAAMQTGYDGFELSDDEARALAPQLDQALQRYLPQIDPGNAPIIMLGVSLVIVTAQKIAGWTKWKRDTINVMPTRREEGPPEAAAPPDYSPPRTPFGFPTLAPG